MEGRGSARDTTHKRHRVVAIPSCSVQRAAARLTGEFKPSVLSGSRVNAPDTRIAEIAVRQHGLVRTSDLGRRSAWTRAR